ncbi:MAG: serine--tRNA ligase [Candidatus Nomurabacteria bacterium]|nr:serine--tRNA ligase [Candidatus Nomurabacteria bacterium]
MLDINFIRDNVDIIKDAARKKHSKVDIDRLVQLDDERKQKLGVVESLRAEQNTASRAVATASNNTEREQLISEMKLLKEDLQAREDELKKIMGDWREIMLQVPNVPDMSVPEGKTDEDNQEFKVWGEKPQFDFEPKDHIELMEDLDMVDFTRGTKVHGFRGYFLKNDGALLSFAIWQYAMDFFTKKGLSPMLPPAIVRKSNLYGTGHLPNEADDIYQTQDDDYLAGTAEVPTMGYYADEVLTAEQLDNAKFLSFSPCYRREAGSHGKDIKGLIRVHEFYKLEQVILCEASHEKSVEYHEQLNRNTEEFIESLNIPYHTVINCAGDLGQGQVKKYDIELWVPREETYREISSASYFHDFQTRRFNIRYKDESGKMRFAHSLNSTAIPTPRVLVSMMENFQNADGSVTIPEVLRKYMGGRERIEK